MASRSKARETDGETPSPLLNWIAARGLKQSVVAKTLGYTPSGISKMIARELDPNVPDPPPLRFRKGLLREYPGPDTERLCARWERDQ